MKKSALLILMISVFLLGVDSRSTTSDDPMLAHAFANEGPWFEGWYTRLTDPKTGLSVAVITTSAISNGQTLGADGQPPGYAAIALKIPSENKTISYEAFPKATRIGNHGKDFRWLTPGSYVSTTLTDVQVTDANMRHARVHIEVLDRKPWAADGSESGPEGFLGNLPILPLHWFVHNTSGQARYALDYSSGGVVHHLEGTGFVHQEKNWGKTFPKSWVWAEAINADGSASIALAGGDLELGPLTAHSYMVGYRSKNFAADFRLIDGLASAFTDEIDACHARFNLIATNSLYELHIDAVAPPQSFASLSIPTDTGYTPDGAIESFFTHFRARLYRKTGSPYWPSTELVETIEFENGALEFGARAMKTCVH